MSAPLPRPGPVRWLSYAFWFALPEQYREWVLYDTTCSTWVLRHVARTLVVATIPVTAVVVLLPGGAELRGLTAFVAGACCTLFVTLYINEGTEHRLNQAGYPWGTGERVRAQRAEGADFRASLGRWERDQRRQERLRRRRSR